MNASSNTRESHDKRQHGKHPAPLAGKRQNGKRCQHREGCVVRRKPVITTLGDERCKVMRNKRTNIWVQRASHLSQHCRKTQTERCLHCHAKAQLLRQPPPYVRCQRRHNNKQVLRRKNNQKSHKGYSPFASNCFLPPGRSSSACVSCGVSSPSSDTTSASSPGFASPPAASLAAWSA